MSVFFLSFFQKVIEDKKKGKLQFISPDASGTADGIWDPDKAREKIRQKKGRISCIYIGEIRDEEFQ